MNPKQIPQEASPISQGAEAKIYLNSSNNIVKDRVPKTYRHKTLDDKIRTKRTKAESKILIKASEAKINVPKIITQNTDKFKIHLEFIKGDRLSETLNSYTKQKQISTMKKIAHQVSKLHENNIIHSDLTTSNLILQEKTSKIFIIDFGLSYISTKIEDKAVDIHLLRQALQAKHFQNSEILFKTFCENYQWQDSIKALERLKIVESRGRYKH
jgi:Kae1-associated kinase Bud32